MKSLPVGGFNYDNCLRNHALENAKPGEMAKDKFMKTGTTICGVVFKVRRILNILILNYVGWCCLGC